MKGFKMTTREHYAMRFAQLRSIKQEKEEATRWQRFLKDRTEFDEELANRLDAYEFMMKSIEGRK
jgi:phage/plasmid-associated DNA primase